MPAVQGSDNGEYLDMRKYVVLVMAAAAGCTFSGVRAATIDIDGRLADSTEACAMEWGDNSGRGDSGNTTAVPVGSNMPDPVSDYDGTVTLTVAPHIQDWRTGYSAGSYDAGEEWNVRSSSSATTAADAFAAG
uniref:hypothetical protein n=1 Tax=Pontiella sp. TaxID=2837462 RepID=UPI00356A300B